eukprot:GHVP01068281.1.p1 GENE.GHVP01068281.1~~GHVP01068281.1.p1  ORF type:complete len:176 (+),score=26.74 GHVP01068281.1:81-608(+)
MILKSLKSSGIHHNDLRNANMVYNFEHNRLSVIDWEMVSTGFPENDMFKYFHLNCFNTSPPLIQAIRRVFHKYSELALRKAGKEKFTEITEEFLKFAAQLQADWIAQKDLTKEVKDLEKEVASDWETNWKDTDIDFLAWTNLYSFFCFPNPVGLYNYLNYEGWMQQVGEGNEKSS